MVENFNSIGAQHLAQLGQKMNSTSKADITADGQDFKSMLMKSINEVNQLQTEAEKATTDLVTGKTDNVAEVMTAVKKAGLAFDMLMQMRTELMNAYDEIKQMRV